MEWTKGDALTDGDAAPSEEQGKQWMNKEVQVG
jgi:hypothetical protein